MKATPITFRKIKTKAYGEVSFTKDDGLAISLPETDADINQLFETEQSRVDFFANAILSIVKGQIRKSATEYEAGSTVDALKTSISQFVTTWTPASVIKLKKSQIADNASAAIEMIQKGDLANMDPAEALKLLQSILLAKG